MFLQKNKQTDLIQLLRNLQWCGEQVFNRYEETQSLRARPLVQLGTGLYAYPSCPLTITKKTLAFNFENGNAKNFNRPFRKVEFSGRCFVAATESLVNMEVEMELKKKDEDTSEPLPEALRTDEFSVER